MAKDPIVFALANPEPEIDPDEIADLTAVVATGRSDYPNQVNNALAFPGLFRGVLGHHRATLDEEVFIAAGHALADLTTSPSPQRLLPDIFDPRVVDAVADAVQATLSHRSIPPPAGAVDTTNTSTAPGPPEQGEPHA